MEGRGGGGGGDGGGGSVALQCYNRQRGITRSVKKLGGISYLVTGFCSADKLQSDVGVNTQC